MHLTDYSSNIQYMKIHIKTQEQRLCIAQKSNTENVPCIDHACFRTELNVA